MFYYSYLHIYIISQKQISSIFGEQFTFGKGVTKGYI